MSYGEEWRARARSGMALSALERERWELEMAWDRANSALAIRLDELVGTMVATIRALHTIDDAIVPIGARFLVRARFANRLLCESMTHGLLSFSPAWVGAQEREPAQPMAPLG